MLPQKELDARSKPKYFYRLFPGRDDVFIRMASYFQPDYRFIAPGVVNPDQSKKFTEPTADTYKTYEPGRYLKYFIQDCSNSSIGGKVLQPILAMDKAGEVKTMRDWSIDRYFSEFEKRSSSDRYPYTMRYEVKAVKLGNMKELRRYNEEAIQIEVLGTIIDFQGKPFSQKQEKIQKITRQGAI